jgi:methionyl-tRNA formyltransferase
MRVIFLAYRDWSLNVSPIVERHSKVSEMRLCKTTQDLKALDLSTYDLIISCGWSEELGREVTSMIEVIGVHCAELDRYSYGTPIQLQIIDGITRSKHRIFSFTSDDSSIRAHTHNRLFSHEVDLELSGNMSDILEQLIATSKVLFTRYLDDYPNIKWREWPAEAIVRSKRRPEDSMLTKTQIEQMNTKQLYDFFRCLEDPYPNGYIEDEHGRLYINKVTYKEGGK